MRVFMLGWEFPPFISGGLGTACYGLTRALSEQQTKVTFVLPKHIDSEYTAHVKLLAPQAPSAAAGDRSPDAVSSTYAIDPVTQKPLPSQAKPGTGTDTSAAVAGAASEQGFEHVTFKAVPSRMSSPYLTTTAKPGAQPVTPTRRTTPPTSATPPETPGHDATRLGPDLSDATTTTTEAPQPNAAPRPSRPTPAGPSQKRINMLGDGPMSGPADPDAPTGHTPNTVGGLDYHGDLFAEAHRYAALCVDLAEGEDFDVIHAHDWLTFPAGLAVAAATGKPLVVHVHSTEIDRSGDHPHARVYDIERRGMHAATRVICVSHWTKAIVEENYGIDPDSIDVIYNGIESPPAQTQNKAAAPAAPAIRQDDKLVLYLGRITMQKGPEYFVEAAKKVLQKMDNVKFIMAGSGDKVRDIIELAAAHGIGHKVLFTGFLRGDDVPKVYEMADVFVMPSVSEPFGIAPLEAITHDTPVIVSKQSGVSEVLKHALKVDFWDTDEMANKIIAVLKHAPLSKTLSDHATIEVKQLTWADAAKKCEAVYEKAAAVMMAV